MRIATLVLALAGTPVMAQENYSYECTKADQPPQELRVTYSKSDSPVPCEVSYTTQGETEALWSAAVKAGYCEAKAESFIKQQRQLGWHCEKAGGD